MLSFSTSFPEDLVLIHLLLPSFTPGRMAILMGASLML